MGEIGDRFDGPTKRFPEGNTSVRVEENKPVKRTPEGDPDGEPHPDRKKEQPKPKESVIEPGDMKPKDEEELWPKEPGEVKGGNVDFKA